MNSIAAKIGDRVEDIDTPALVLELDAFERNLRTLAGSVKGRSVPAWRSTRYSAGDSRTRHSSSVFGSSVSALSMHPTVDRHIRYGDYRLRTSLGTAW